MRSKSGEMEVNNVRKEVKCYSVLLFLKILIFSCKILQSFARNNVSRKLQPLVKMT